MTTALDGIRVVDLTAGLAGPVAGMLLADLGADVIKIYPPGGGPAPDAPGRHMWDRGKRSAVADPADPADLAVLSDLIGLADIVLMGADASGGLVGHAELTARGLAPGRPASWIVMPPYLLGETPWAGPGRAGGAESAGLLFAWAGHAWNQASYDDVPVDCVFPVALIMQGIWAATTAVALLAGRQLGRTVAPLVVAGGAHGAELVSPGGFAAARSEPHEHRPGGPGGTLANYRCYRCADGQWLFFGAFTNAFIRRGFAAVGAGWILDDPRIGGDISRVRRGENLGWVTRELEQAFTARSRAECLAALEAADCPAAPAGHTADWLDHEQVRAIGLRAELRNDAGQDIVMPGPLIGLSQTPVQLRGPAPTRHPAITALDAGWPARDPAPPGAAAGNGAAGRGAGAGSGSLELPLAGLRVLNLGTIIAGPYTATLLGELGAEVWKIERPPHGDEFRTAHGGRGGAGFSVYNRDQRSLLVDLASEPGAGVFADLVRVSDVVVDNYRVGVLGRLGIDHDRLAAVNPLVTTVSVSAFGEAGDLAQRPGFDPVVQAMSGIMRGQGGADEANSPVFLTVPINDVLAGALATLGTCAALFTRARIGRGQRITVTLCASSCLLQSPWLVRVPGVAPSAPAGGRDFPGPAALDRLYRGADGWARLAAPGSRELAGLARADLISGEPLTGADGTGGTGGNDAARDAALAAAIAAHVAALPVAEILRRAALAGIPAVRARQGHELVADDQLIRHGLLSVVERDESGVSRVLPGRWLEVPGLRRDPPGPPPAVAGQHADEILAEAGLTPADHP
ncbi:MAG TPA: CoA transferase [Streptosporangiaceae bacterium]|jgi:crotonobetainyl-CoA:carnitine CoA-transferase CaiB-like acyl-CoA transferase